MSEAYEIGIKLALDNGVSEGLDLVRRDLSATDVAVEASAARLALFTRAAQAALGIAQAAAGAPVTTPPFPTRLHHLTHLPLLPCPFSRSHLPEPHPRPFLRRRPRLLLRQLPP